MMILKRTLVLYYQNKGKKPMTHFNLQQCKDIIVQVGNDGFLKLLVAYFMCFYAYAFGDGTVLIPVFLLVIFDGILGVIKAIKNKEVSSRGFIRGALKFLVYLILMGMSGILDREFPGQYATTTMKSFLMITEAISIMENVAALGWPVPLKLLEFLRMHHDKRVFKKKDWFIDRLQCKIFTIK